MPKEIIPPKGAKHVLDSRDAVFAGIRDLHLSSALVKLKETGASLKQMHSSRQDMNLSDMKLFIVTQMKDLQTQYKSLNMRQYHFLPIHSLNPFSHLLHRHFCLRDHHERQKGTFVC